MDINDLLFENDQQRPTGGPPMARERFTPSEKTKDFLNDCRERGYDISTIINLAIDCFAPKAKNNNYTWDGIDDIIRGKKKWF